MVLQKYTDVYRQQSKIINKWKLKVSGNSRKSAIEDRGHVEVHSYKVFKNKYFNFNMCNSCPSKQRAFLSLQRRHVRYKRNNFTNPPITPLAKMPCPTWWILHHRIRHYPRDTKQEEDHRSQLPSYRTM